MIYFTDEIRRSAESGKLTGALFIDLRKASDSVPHNPMTKKARSCWLSWLFHAFLPLKKLGKGLKSKEILGFPGKPGVVFQEKPGEPGGNSWLSRKAWNLTTVGRARKAKKARNYQKCAGFHREAGVTDCCIAKNSQESQE